MNSFAKELMHHGIQGMHWGERNGPPYPLDTKMSRKIQSTPKTQLTRDQYLAIKNLKKAKTANIDKFGKTPETNTLFIAGYSGSGKSTTALGIARKNDHVIHLDGYSDSYVNPKESNALQNKALNKFLDKKVPRWREFGMARSDPKNKEMKRYTDEYWKLVDDFRKGIESFSKQEFKKGNRVIVEGVQMADDWFAPDKTYYSGKPMITLGTSALTSMKRAFERDERGGLIKGLIGLDSPIGQLNWYRLTNRNLSELVSKSGTVEKGKKYINELVKVI
jgi:energy-coupling factor transporter ATP-binding protein EcfA2